jgi:hypothetical protein
MTTIDSASTLEANDTNAGGTGMLAREKWQIKTIAVLDRVFEERVRQVAQYGHNEELEDGTGPDARCWARPLSGMSNKSVEREFRHEYEQHEKEHGLPTWMHLIREEVAEAFELAGDDPKFVEEILQVAALCVSWAEKKLEMQAGKLVPITKTNPAGETRRCDRRDIHESHEWQADFGAYFNVWCPGNDGTQR